MSIIKGVCVMVNSISGIGSKFTTAVPAISFSCNQLDPELIKKLLELGIDPSKVTSNEQAKTLITQKIKELKSQQGQQAQAEQNPSSTVDMRQLKDDIGELGKKIGINPDTIKDLSRIVEAYQVGVNNYVEAAKKSAGVNGVNNAKKITNIDIKEKPENIQEAFVSIRDRVNTVKNEKKAAFQGQDMLAMLNRLQLGL